jgi:transcriptional regulator with XRE-family HTH domain
VPDVAKIPPAQRRLVAERIREARLAATYSLDGLALEVGSSRQHLIKLEKGTHYPRPGLLAALAVATEKSVEWLEGVEENPEPTASLPKATVGSDNGG